MKAHHQSDITLRSVLIGLCLLLLNAYWIAMVEMVWHGFHFSATSMPLNVVFFLFVLAFINLIAEKYIPKYALRQGEMLVIYIMLAVTTSVIAHDNMVSLMGLLCHAFWFATPENDWKRLIQPYLPRWLVMDNISAARPFYEGGASFFRDGYAKYWIAPVLSWTAIALLIFMLVAFLNVILRRQWIEYEKLPYPIAQFPMDMTVPGIQFFRNRLMWVGFAIAFIIEIINGLNYLYPEIPLIPIRERSSDLALLFTDEPWNVLGPTYIHFRLFLIGLCFLLPIDLSFSAWFFYVVRKVQFVGGKAIGLYTIPYYPFQPQQAAGAFFVIVLMAIWGGRRYFMQILKKIIETSRRDISTVDDSKEPVSYRTAAFGILSCLILLFFLFRAAGMSLWVFILFFGLYITVSIAITRVRAELGPPVHDMSGVNPQTILITVIGVKPFGIRNLVAFSLFAWFNGTNRSHPMPHQLEGFKLAQRVGMNNRKLLLVMILAITVGVFSAFWVYLHALYKFGASVAVDAPGQVLGPGWGTYNQFAGWLQFPDPVDVYGSLSILGGFVFALFLGLMRLHFIWWPFHPLGYAIGINGASLDHYWLIMMLTSIVKYVALKYGGARGYRKLLPFFLGLLLGDVVSGCYWSILSVIIEKPLYVVWFW